MKQYDVIVIGSGGGSKITRPAANLGLNVAVIEKSELGGTCLNFGCIPSKMLIQPAEVISAIQDAHRFSIATNPNPEVDFAGLMDRVISTIEAESNSIAPLYDNHHNITFYREEASFVSDKVIKVGDEHITAPLIFVAVGARPKVPAIPGLAATPYLTYKEVLRLRSLPTRTIILGGGYIATELGYFLSQMGSEVTFLLRSKFLRHEDHDVVEEFDRVFSKNHNVIRGARVEHVSYEGDEFKINILDDDDTPQVLESDAFFIATGVTPNSDTLKLGHTEICYDDNGFIQVNDHLETSVPGVYAFGDVIGRYLFRHSVNYEGEYLFNTVIRKTQSGPIKYPPMPHAVFTHPQIGGVGATEDELRLSGHDYVVGKNDYKASAMGMALLSDHGFVKLLFDKHSKRLLGAHIIGPEASNMIHMLIAFMKMEATLDDMLDTIYVHPALPEIVRNAARKARTLFESS